MMKPSHKTTIMVTRRWTEAVYDELAERYDARLNLDDRELSAEDIIAGCEGVTVLCPTTMDAIDAAFIARLPDSVRLLAGFGAGTEHIDVAAALERQILVSNTPGAVTEDTADIAFALILAACRRLVHGDNHLRAGRWDGVRIDEPLAGVSVWGSTIGIVGLGQIGRAVARRARAFGMQVLYHNRNRQVDAETEFNATYCPDFSELLALSDVVSLHCPLTPATHHLIDRAALSQMKSTAVLINTARGPVVDESALIECLRRGGIFAAGLDVYEHEPKVSTELMALGNVVLAPHLGTATRNARDAMGMRVIANIEAFLSTGSPGDQVTA